MTRIDIERTTPPGSRLLWLVFGLIAIIVVGVILWFFFGRRVMPGRDTERMMAARSVVCSHVRGEAASHV